jgi:3-oxoadipate enol-lactonase
VTSREVLFVDSGGEQIGVEIAGSGPALVLLHGSGGNRATWWRQVAALAADFTVVAVEARGAGRSTGAESSGPVSGTADLEAVRTHLGLDAWHVLGHSLGGWTALRYACTYPAVTTSCVLVSSYAGVFPPVADAHWQALAVRPWLPAALARPASLTADFCDADPFAAHLYQLVGALNPPPSPDSPAARIRDHDLGTADLARLACPVTCIVGSLDDIAPVTAVREVAGVLGADVRVMEGAGHVPFWEQPEEFNALLRSVLR